MIHPRKAIAGLLVAAGTAHAAGTLTFCSDAAPEGFDVVRYTTVPTEDAAGLPLYDKLTRFKLGTTQVEPALAERWELSADGKTYTFHLRKGVKFHATPWFTPTRDFNADDVLWSMNRMNDPQHPAHKASASGYPYWAAMEMPKLIKSIGKVDPYTVRIELTHPEAAFIADMAMSSIASVVSAEYGEQLAKAGKLEQLNTQPVGTGPYVFKSYQKDATIRYAAHKAYWGGAPKVDNLVFAITPDPSVRLQRVRAGECLVAEVLGEHVSTVKADAKLNVLLNHALMTAYVAPNAQKPFTSDKRFRQALSLAIDRANYVKVVYGGLADAAGSFLPPGIWSHDDSLKRGLDLDRARALVKASGYDGRELNLYATARTADIARGVELLQADWARIGVKVKVQLMELGELYKRTGRGDHDLALLSWFSDNGDPDNFFTPNLSCAAVDGGSNKARWCNPAFDRLLAKGTSTADLPQRTATYREAQALLHEEAAVLPLAYRARPYAVSKRVSGYVATPFGASDFRAVQIQ